MTTVTVTGQQAPPTGRSGCGWGASFPPSGCCTCVGWGLFLYYARSAPALAGLGMLAYTFGLRHAFDADHIAAIDNTTRKLLAQGRKPMGVGFFFSLGHSTIVFGLVAGLAAARHARSTRTSPAFQDLRRLHRRERLRDVPAG